MPCLYVHGNAYALVCYIKPFISSDDPLRGV